jgi:hypothetical protein
MVWGAGRSKRRAKEVFSQKREGAARIMRFLRPKGLDGASSRLFDERRPLTQARRLALSSSSSFA